LGNILDLKVKKILNRLLLFEEKIGISKKRNLKTKKKRSYLTQLTFYLIHPPIIKIKSER
jgi:hypothetical protein